MAELVAWGASNRVIRWKVNLSIEGILDMSDWSLDMSDWYWSVPQRRISSLLVGGVGSC